MNRNHKFLRRSFHFLEYLAPLIFIRIVQMLPETLAVKAGETVTWLIYRLPKYQRIILVGHSLGTVIGYDVLTHLWSQFNHEFKPKSTPSNTVLEEMQKLARELEKAVEPLRLTRRGRGAWPEPTEAIKKLAEAFRARQHKYLKQLNDSGNRWCVSDFVTMGSPLTHADLLVADNPVDLTQRQERRYSKRGPVE